MLTRPVWVRLLLLLPCLAVLGLLYVYPVAGVLSHSVHDGPQLTLRYYAQFFGVPAYLKILWITLAWSAVITGLCAVFAYPVAYMLSTARPAVFNVVVVFVLLPFLMSLLIRTYAWRILLGHNGVINILLMKSGLITDPLPISNNAFAVVVGMVQILLPLMILSLYSAMQNVDLGLVRAAETLGANPLRAFWAVHLPLSLPGVAAGCLLVFIVSVGFFITPDLLGGPRDVWLSMLIETQVSQLTDWGFASALATILLVVILAIFVLYERVWGLDRLWGE